MERFVPILFILFLSVSNLIAQDNKIQFYGNIGFSFFDQKDLSRLGDDAGGLHLGLGLQITDLIGIEIAGDEAPAFDRRDDEGPTRIEPITGNPYLESYSGYKYLSLMGTLTKRFEHDFFQSLNDYSIVVKGGVASYNGVKRRYFEFDIQNPHIQRVESFIAEDGFDMVLSFGVLYHATEKQDFEWSVRKVFGNASTLSWNIYWKYKFFKF